MSSNLTGPGVNGTKLIKNKLKMDKYINLTSVALSPRYLSKYPIAISQNSQVTPFFGFFTAGRIEKIVLK